MKKLAELFPKVEDRPWGFRGDEDSDWVVNATGTMLDTTEIQNREAVVHAINNYDALVELVGKLKATLELIAGSEGKCLLGPGDGMEASTPFQMGSNRAFNQQAGEAKDALTAVEEWEKKEERND